MRGYTCLNTFQQFGGRLRATLRGVINVRGSLRGNALEVTVDLPVVLVVKEVLQLAGDKRVNDDEELVHFHLV